MESETEQKTFNYWTRKELEALPHRNWNADIGSFSSLIILPTRRLHDSGYRMMDFVAVNDNDIPFIRLSGCSDAVHIDGISGIGPHELVEKMLPLGIVKSKGWSIDCLKASGLLRIFCMGRLKSGEALSSFELYGYTESELKFLEGK